MHVKTRAGRMTAAGAFAIAACVVLVPRPAEAAPVDLELLLAADVSGSIDDVDFALQRAGFAAAFRNLSVIAAIEAGAIGSIAVALWDFAEDVGVAVDWTLVSDGAGANAFADAVADAPRGSLGLTDGQSNLMNLALTSVNTNRFEGARRVLDIASEGAQDVDGCEFDDVNCPAVQRARDAFLAGGGTTINAIWLNDRDFFGLDPTDLVNAFKYGSQNVIGGAGAFQVFAPDFTQFEGAIQAKILREVDVVPEPVTLLLLGSAVAAVQLRRRFTGAAARRRRP